MLWPVLLGIGALFGVASAKPRSVVVVLRAGVSYRFIIAIESNAPLTDAQLQLLQRGLVSMGGRNVLVTRASPVLAMFDWTVPTHRTVEIGKAYAPFEAIASVALLTIRIVEVRESDAT